MSESWKGVGKRWKLKDAQNMDIFQINALPLHEKAELAQFYYRQFQLRQAGFVRSMRVPYAYSKIIRDFNKIQASPNLTAEQRGLTLDVPVVVSEKGERRLNDNFANALNPDPLLNQYIRRMQDFFASKSSTVKGWDEIARAQDIALFGATYESVPKYKYQKDPITGKRKRVYLYGPFVKVSPKDTLSDAERVKLWEIIDLAKDAGWMNQFGYSSEQLHREIASMWVSGDISHSDIEAAYATILDEINKNQKGLNLYPEYQPGIKGNPSARNGEGGDIKDVFGRQSDWSDNLSGDDDPLQ